MLLPPARPALLRLACGEAGPGVSARRTWQGARKRSGGQAARRAAMHARPAARAPARDALDFVAKLLQVCLESLRLERRQLGLPSAMADRFVRQAPRQDEAGERHRAARDTRGRGAPRGRRSHLHLVEAFEQALLVLAHPSSPTPGRRSWDPRTLKWLALEPIKRAIFMKLMRKRLAGIRAAPPCGAIVGHGGVGSRV